MGYYSPHPIPDLDHLCCDSAEAKCKEFHARFLDSTVIDSGAIN